MFLFSSLGRVVFVLTFLFGSYANAQSNLVLRSAQQSSTTYSGLASHAIDGSTNGVYSNRSVTHTATQEHPWWQAELESSTNISQIKIWNRTDGCCAGRLSKFWVFVSTQPFAADADRSYKTGNDPNVVFDRTDLSAEGRPHQILP